MNQEPLFCEDIYEAIRVAVAALGGAKKVGAMLWPDKPLDKAAAQLNDCLNRTRQEKLDPEQVTLIEREARKVGCHAIATFRNAETGYAPPLPLEPEDERDALRREYIRSTKALDALVKRMERLGGLE